MSCRTASEFIDSRADLVDQSLAFVYGLLALSIVIAVFGIVLTLLLAVYERRRETGLLRAVGMTRAQVRTTVRWESVLTSVYGAVVGVVMGLVLGLRRDRRAARSGPHQVLRAGRDDRRDHPASRSSSVSSLPSCRPGGRRNSTSCRRSPQNDARCEVSPDDACRSSRNAILATLTTLRADGSPHVVPVGFSYDAECGRRSHHHIRLVGEGAQRGPSAAGPRSVRSTAAGGPHWRV